jgi:hypothetical protein
MRSGALNVGLMKPDNSLRVSERGLLKILWQKRNDVAGDLEVTAQWRASWSPLLVTEFYYCDKIKKYEMVGTCDMLRGRISAFWVFVEKPEGKRLYRTHMRLQNNNFRTNLQEIGWCVDSNDLTQYRDNCGVLCGACRNFRLNNMPWISWLAEGILAFHKQFCSIKLDG